MADFIDEVKAAQDWTLKSIPDKSHAKLCEAFTLLSPKFDVPFENKVAFTLRLATDLLTARQFDKWARCTQPFFNDTEPQDSWSPGDASFALLPWSTIPESALERHFEKWSSSVIGDPYVSLVADATSSDEEAMAGPLMAACRSWLGMWSDAEDTVPKLWADSSALDCVVHTLRGLLGLCDPTPFPCSCGIADINFVMPLDKKKKGDPPGLAEMFDKLSYSRSLWRWMNKPEGVGTAPARENLWPSRKSAYVMAVAGENQYGQHVNAAYKSAQDLSRALGIGNAVDVGTLSIPDENKDINEQTAFLSTYEKSIEVLGPQSAAWRLPPSAAAGRHPL